MNYNALKALIVATADHERQTEHHIFLPIAQDTLECQSCFAQWVYSPKQNEAIQTVSNKED